MISIIQVQVIQLKIKKNDNESKVIYDTEYLSFENIHNENDLKLFSYIDRTTQYNKEMKEFNYQ